MCEIHHTSIFVIFTPAKHPLLLQLNALDDLADCFLIGADGGLGADQFDKVVACPIRVSR